MNFEIEFKPVALEELHREAAVKKVEGWRFIQTHAVNTDDGIDLYYSFMKNGRVENLKVQGVTKENPVPSITDLFLAAFVFENEARELFGVDMRDIAIDFAGAMYAPAEAEPMTFMSPEQKAARDKARKAQAAKAAKTSDASVKEPDIKPAGQAKGFVMTPERRERLDKKLANLSPEKVAKVEAALKAREAEAAAAKGAPEPEKAKPATKVETVAEQKAATVFEEKPATDRQLESAISLMGAEKAEKVRVAIAARNGDVAPIEAYEPEPLNLDSDLEAKIALLDADKAKKVREALAAKASREASSKGGE